MIILAPGIHVRADGAVEIDAAIVYPLLAKELGFAEADLTQYHLEIIHQCAKLEALRLAGGTEHDPRRQGRALHIRIVSGGDKKRWQMKHRPVGEGPALASRGKHARGHYKRIRGALPK